MQVRDLMSSPVITIRPEATIKEAARLMVANHISCLPVMDGSGRLVGILTHTDFGLHPKYLPLAGNLYQMLGASGTPQRIEEVSRQVGQKRVADVMSHHVITISEDASVAEAADLMLSKEIHRLPALREGRLVGILTRHDLVKLIAQV